MTYLILYKNTRIMWKHFEALRLKLARTLAARAKLSKKSQYKHQKTKDKRKKVTRPTRVKRLQKIWYLGFPHLAYWTKGRSSRMGKGKGSLNCWYYSGRAGQPIIKFVHLNTLVMRQALYKVCQLLPVTDRKSVV